MKNYLDHEIKVKYVDGILSHSQDWMWFIDYIQENYELQDVNSWDSFSKDSNHLRDIYGYFIKIQTVSSIDIDTVEHSILREIIYVSQFYLGQIDIQQCKAIIESNYGRLLFVVTWTTKRLSRDNQDYSFSYDLRLFIRRNIWQVLKLDSILSEREAISKEMNYLNIDGMETCNRCLNDNLDFILYPANESFLNNNKESFISANAFSFNRIAANYQTWQEEYLVDMVNVSFGAKGIQPAFVSGEYSFPNVALWTTEILQEIKEFYSNDIATFVIDSIAYMLHNVKPDAVTVEKHCSLLTDAVSNLERYELFSCSSFIFMSKIFCDKEVKRTISGLDSFVNLIKVMQEFKDADSIMVIKEHGFPLSKTQKDVLNNYVFDYLKQIQEINACSELLRFLDNKEIAKHIDTPHLVQLFECFRRCTKTEQSIITATTFYEYMVFLLKVNSEGINIDRRLVQYEIINVQKAWKDSYYAKEIKSLKTISHEMSIERDQVKKHNELIVKAPIVFAASCMAGSNDEICSIMELASEHPLMHMVSSIEINPIYPKKNIGLNYSRHDVDALLKEIVERIIEEKGYKLLNVLDVDAYVKGIHERYKLNLNTGMQLFFETDALFDEIQEYSPFELLPVSGNKTTLANLSQLFPVLEMAIRDLAELTGYVPFKENVEDFMAYKDPSSILREIIKDVYSETKCFENIPDLIFVYNHMYNGNSSNIRNEVIHGRNYLNGSSLILAYRATLVSIHMILMRIDMIKKNHNS